MHPSLFYAVSLLCAARCMAADFTVITTANSGPGSLRQAILDANSLPGPDRIVFNIPGAGVQTIDVSANMLPGITDTLTIDGYTQPGSKPNDLASGDNAVVLVRIDGGAVATPSTGGTGLAISAPNCVVRGLMLTRFAQYSQGTLRAGGHGISIGSANCVVEGNFIGTDGTGNAVLGNTGAGVRILFGSGNVIGGNTPAARNVISGNTTGIYVSGSNNFPANNTLIAGNQIGTDQGGPTPATGNVVGIAMANAEVNGTFLNTVIGGTDSASSNLISGNDVGIRLAFTDPGTAVTTRANGVAVYGNAIGLQPHAATPAVNQRIGVEILGANNMVGALTPGAANRIAFNQSGVVVQGSPTGGEANGNRILSNEIYANSTIGIDLVATSNGAFGFGSTSNDLGDPDTGPNKLQNFPVIISVTQDSAGDAIIKGALNSTPSTTFTVQVFATLANNAGQTLLSTQTVTTDSNGNASFQVTYPGNLSGSSITSTATDAEGNTSEFTPINGPVQLANLSTRAFVETGDKILIAGFIVTGNNSKKVGIRALGPSVNTPNHLDDPKLELRDSAGTLLAKNDDWKAGQQQEVMNAGLAPSSDLEAALVTTLNPGSYTALVQDTNNDTGNGVVEVYDLDSFPATTSRLVNLSSRAPVHTGDDILIGGMIVRGDAAEKLVIRAIGPDLSQSGVPNPLQDPTLEVRDASGALVASNDNWRDFNADPIPVILQPKDDRDSAVAVTLPPGNYTAIVRGKGSDTGVALVEIYDLTN